MQRALLAVALCAAGAAHSAGVYKHVDAQGRVTYTDQPPQDASTRTEQVTLRDDTGGIAPHLEGDWVLCGTIFLGNRTDLVSLGGKLGERRSGYVEELESARREHAQLSRGTSASSRFEAERLTGALTRVRELECAIAWVDRQRANSADIVGAARAPVAAIEAEIATLERQRLANCGAAPRAYDPKIGDSAEALEAVWKRCQDMYDTQVADWQRKRARHQATVDAVSEPAR